MSHAISAPICEQGEQVGDVDEAIAVRVLDAVAADAPRGECSRYCEVGIDVMSFAKNQQSFSNENTSCIHCGICVTVCPRMC